MKKIIAIGALLIVISTLIIAGCISTGPAPIPITYYYSSNCSTACERMDVVFNNLSATHRGEFTLTKYDMNQEQVKFYNDQIAHNGDGTVPFVFVSNLTLNGYHDGCEQTLEYYIVNREQFRNFGMVSNATSQR